MNGQSQDPAALARHTLVVEDDRGLGTLVVKALRRAGYQAAGAATGAEAFEYLSRNSDLLMLLDLSLPDISGRELIDRLAGAGIQVPFIVMTGQSDVRLAVEMMKLGASDFLLKDMNFLEILPEVVARVFHNLETEERLRVKDEKLRWNESLLQLMAGSSPLGFFVVDNRTDDILYFNQRFCEMWGIEHLSERMARGELKNRDIIPACLPMVADVPAFAESCKPLQDEHNRAIVEDEIAFTAGRAVRRFSTQIRGMNDEYFGRFYIFEDITERKRAEEALLHAQKMESLGILAGGVAHDFNNLLVALLGQTSLAAARLPPEHPAQQHLERAVTAARRAADLTRQMLAYAGHGVFHMAPLNLNTLVRDITGFLESSIAKSIALRTDLMEPLPLINADAGQMQQIIMNLVLNAAEAIGEHAGSIRVATRVIDVTADDGRWANFIGQAVTAGRYVELQVQDSGSGMSAETLSRIFDPFFTTKFTGRGLGLAAVLGIVRGHQGGLWVESEVDRGTTFTLAFPVTEAEAIVAPKTTTPGQTASTQQVVLVIDDEEPVLEAITDMLALDNVSVLCAATGKEGIALFREQQADIGLVLLDLSMPGLSGRETFDQLRQIDPRARIVLSSGYTRTEATRAFAGLALAGFLHKPYDLETLLETVRQHLRSRDGDSPSALQ